MCSIAPHTTRVAIRIFDLLDSSEVAPRRQPCCFRRQPTTLMVSGQHLQVRADLFIEGRIERPSRERRLDTLQRRSKSHDEGSPSIRLIIATVRDHRSASSASCFLPARGSSRSGRADCSRSFLSRSRSSPSVPAEAVPDNRALVECQHPPPSLDAPRNPVAVLRSHRVECLQHHQIERAVRNSRMEGS